MDDGTSPIDVPATASGHFAWFNSQLALQRTLLAGVRTGVSLIGFGFTVAQFFERIRDKVPVTNQVLPDGPRNVGLTLIAAGVGLVGVFLWQYRRMSAHLWGERFKALSSMLEGQYRLSGSYWAAWVVLVIGVVAFASVFARF